MKKLGIFLVASLLVTLVFSAIGCGGGGGGKLASDWSNAENAVVRIVAHGSFVSPEEGSQMNAVFSGSGFIIDPSGICVTNNHVVTGSSYLDVYVGDKRYGAKILGVSECSDLAVIAIEGEGNSFPYLKWYQGTISRNIEVHAIGYALGESQLNVTNGIISKLEAGGRTDWCSVPDSAVIGHSAKVVPGDSGGPLLTKDGSVIGINYAGISSVDMQFAISATYAKDMVARLRTGVNVDSIGVNGQAIQFGGQYTGIWVSATKAGSPASEAGVKPGDIIITLEDMVMAVDGTLYEYCQILSQRSADSKMKIQVYRPDTGELLEGELNGRALETKYSVQTTSTSSSSGYVTVTDDTGAITVEVPSTWKYKDGSNSDTATFAAQLNVAVGNPNNQTYTPEVGIMVFSVSSSGQMTVDKILDAWKSSTSNSCQWVERDPFQDSKHTGKADIYTCNEGGTSTVLSFFAFYPAGKSYLVVVITEIGRAHV
jgi:serine protease Do